jgi:hypothetical protein
VHAGAAADGFALFRAFDAEAAFGQGLMLGGRHCVRCAIAAIPGLDVPFALSARAFLSKWARRSICIGVCDSSSCESLTNS